MGTPDFAVASLDALIKNNFEIVGVVTAPDKPAGRGQQLHESAVKKFAREKGIKVLQPLKLKDAAFISELKALKADLQIVVAFRMLPEAVWNMPSQGTYNLHGSLLPRYRGAAPINWAVINGDRKSGVTTFKLKHDIDTGNILFQEEAEITEDMTAGQLHDVLMEKGAELLIKTVKAIAHSQSTGEALKFITQNDSEASHAPKIFKDDCRIKWNTSGTHIYNFVRGLCPHPTAFTVLQRQGEAPKNIKVFKCRFEKTDVLETNGSLLTDNADFIKVACNDGYIWLEELQIEGKKRLAIKDLLRGFKITEGAVMQ